MTKHLTITANGTQENLQGLTRFFMQECGFPIRHEEKGVLHFKRGSILRNLVAMNPLSWKSDLLINFDHGRADMVLTANTFGQLITPEEAALWDTLFDALDKTLESGYDHSYEVKQALLKTKKSQFKYLLWSGAGAVTGLVPALAMGAPGLIGITGVIGAVSLTSYAIRRERYKKERKGLGEEGKRFRIMD